MTREEHNAYYRARRAAVKNGTWKHFVKMTPEERKESRRAAKKKYRDANKDKTKAYNAANPEKNLARGRAHKEKHKLEFDYISSKIYQAQKNNSKRRGHNPPTYNQEELRSWLKEQPNLNSLMEGYEKSGGDKWFRPSVDRKDNAKGYSFDNIQLMSWKENHDKG